MFNRQYNEISKCRLNRAKSSLECAKMLIDNKLYNDSVNMSYDSILASIRSVLAYDCKDFKEHFKVIKYFHEKYINSNLFDKKYSNIIKNAFEINNKIEFEDFYVATKEIAIIQYNNALKFFGEVINCIEKITK